MARPRNISKCAGCSYLLITYRLVSLIDKLQCKKLDKLCAFALKECKGKYNDYKEIRK